jgi:hypothetical protein
MHRDAIFEELRQIERRVVEGERFLAKREAQLLDLKRQDQDTTKAWAELQAMRGNRQCLEQDRQRILSLLQP